MKLIATFIIAFLAVTITKSEEDITNSKDCSAQLIVEKNRSFKSADQEGAQFILVLTNTSNESKTFNLSTSNLSEPCNNKGQYNRGTASSKNVELDVTFKNNSLNRNSTGISANNDIQLKSGESYRFIVNVQVPSGTPFNTWSCIEVEVKSTDCGSKLDSKTLSVFVPNPSEG